MRLPIGFAVTVALLIAIAITVDAQGDPVCEVSPSSLELHAGPYPGPGVGTFTISNTGDSVLAGTITTNIAPPSSVDILPDPTYSIAPGGSQEFEIYVWGEDCVITFLLDLGTACGNYTVTVIYHDNPPIWIDIDSRVVLTASGVGGWAQCNFRLVNYGCDDDIVYLYLDDPAVGFSLSESQIYVPAQGSERASISYVAMGVDAVQTTLETSSGEITHLVGIVADCNENGFDDQQDIAAHPSLDWNDDGIIDSCQQSFGLSGSQIGDVERSRLHAAHPNPFNPQTTIAFDMPTQEAVSLRVYDVAGRLVTTLIDGEVYGNGRQETVWNGRDGSGRQVASGTYFYRLTAGNYTETKRMVLVK